MAAPYETIRVWFHIVSGVGKYNRTPIIPSASIGSYNTQCFTYCRYIPYLHFLSSRRLVKIMLA